jgi:hypothetical protein
MKSILSSFIRNVLQVFAGALMAYGVSESDASEWVKASEPVLSGLLIYVVAQVWSLKNISNFKKLADRFGVNL